jgi:hypothetical protein
MIFCYILFTHRKLEVSLFFILAVNKITIRYHFPILRVYDLLDQLHGATIFSNLIFVADVIKFA